MGPLLGSIETYLIYSEQCPGPIRPLLYWSRADVQVSTWLHTLFERIEFGQYWLKKLVALPKAAFTAGVVEAPLRMFNLAAIYWWARL